jgi:hypothetical protein
MTDAVAVRRRSGPDRTTVALFTVSAFLVVLGVLISQMHTPPARPKIVVVRRVYRTTVVETVLGQRGGGTSVSQSSASSGSVPTAVVAAPTTRVS